MSTKRTAKDERRERIAELQARQQRAERRRTWLILGISGLVALALVVPTALVLTGEQRRQDEVAAAAEAPIEGVTEVTDLSATHVTTPVDYEQTPPLGGDHHPTWQNCGFYSEPVVDVHAVHSLEHGAVWITYDPELDDSQVAELRALTERHPYLLVSPYDGLEAPLVASAWGLQLPLEGVDDERLEPFLVKYLQGPQTPEPGAACSGGMGA
ncbi:DUF3105 domain-containing protein [Cellulomonas sp. APG4]|uniref:DUF3105 domain-containing protein n=1 Tax=Cellulomonas sp. APG4 TaxID=1538656 RepID=UPI00137A926C|nr:DUF3105 domain-containing protein [Cellulomonas sp. APG4]